MARPFDFGEIKLTAGGDDSSALPSEDTPFRIAILGDFSGHPDRGRTKTSLANCRTLLVDRDNFDEVLAKIGPEVSLPIGGSKALTLRFSELEDFHRIGFSSTPGYFIGCERSVRGSRIPLLSRRLRKSWE